MTCAAALCGLYLELSAQVMLPRSQPANDGWWMYDRTCAANPYAVVAVGYEWQPRESVRVFAEYRHESSVMTRVDRGEDALRVGFRYYPVRR